MCIHIDYCKICDLELDVNIRMADCDEPTTEFNEENELPEDNVENQNDDTGECECSEVFRFKSDEPCYKCKCQNCGQLDPYYRRDGKQIVKGFYCEECIEDKEDEAFNVDEHKIEVILP